jgi:apolipoprotein N-acyltransferase
MISWIIVIVGLWTSWHYTDIASQTTLYSVICPVLVFVFATALAIKLLSFFNPSKGQGSPYGDSGGGSWDGDGGCGGGE